MELPLALYVTYMELPLALLDVRHCVVSAWYLSTLAS